jgi:hypothetical protein
MSAYPTIDESRDRLHRAGWSVGEIATATRWQVCGTNGDDDQPYCLLREMCLGLSSRDQPKKAKPIRVSFPVGSSLFKIY